jgi:hypothetical protein
MKFCPVVPEICRGQVHAYGIKMGGKNSTLSDIIKI